MRALEGDSLQRPPAYSAVKVGGRKLYEARAREQLEAEPRSIRVDAFDLLAFDPPDATFRVVCSTGTYVRVLAADVGRRSRAARISRAPPDGDRPVRSRRRRPARRPGRSAPVEDTVAHLPGSTSSARPSRPRTGGRSASPGSPGRTGLRPDGRLIGVYEDEGPKARPQVILAG